MDIGTKDLKAPPYPQDDITAIPIFLQKFSFMVTMLREWMNLGGRTEAAISYSCKHAAPIRLRTRLLDGDSTEDIRHRTIALVAHGVCSDPGYGRALVAAPSGPAASRTLPRCFVRLVATISSPVPTFPPKFVHPSRQALERGTAAYTSRTLGFDFSVDGLGFLTISRSITCTLLAFGRLCHRPPLKRDCQIRCQAL